MLTEERRDEILRLLAGEGRVDLAGLGDRFGVSEDTIRRDLRELDAAGLIRRVRGGALPRSPAPAAFGGRVERDTAAKDAIARVAADRIRTGMIVGFDAGTTALALARAIPHDVRFTAVTNSLPAAVELGDRESVRCVLLGGTVLASARAAVGIAAFRALREIRLDLAVIGTCGVHAEAGLTAMNAEESEIKRTYCEQADRLLVLATREKLGVADAFGFASIAPHDEIVTDAPPDHPVVGELRARRLAVTLC